MSKVIPSEDDPFLSPGKVAKIFDVKDYTVREWIDQGKLKAIKIAGRWRIQQSEITRFANEKYGADK